MVLVIRWQVSYAARWLSNGLSGDSDVGKYIYQNLGFYGEAQLDARKNIAEMPGDMVQLNVIRYLRSITRSFI